MLHDRRPRAGRVGGQPERSAVPERLSSRQAEVANLVVSGRSSREIAAILSLSPRTVETHIAAVFDKLGVSSRVELIPAGLAVAAALVGFIDVLLDQVHAMRQDSERSEDERIRAILREHLPAGELDALLAEGARMSEDRAVGVALSMPHASGESGERALQVGRSASQTLL